MQHIDRAWDLLTSDPLILLVCATLAIALVALYVVAIWAPREAPRAPSARRKQVERSSRAHQLVASGTELAEVSRRTGLSRDALALMSGEHGATPAAPAARQKGPKAARLSLSWRSPFAGPQRREAGEVTA